MASSLDDAKFCGDKLTCGSGSYMSQHFAENSVLNGISGYLSKLGYGKDRSEKFYAEIAIYQVDGCERSTRVGGWDFTATINRDGNITVLQKT